MLEIQIYFLTNSDSISLSSRLSLPLFWSITRAVPLGVTHTTLLPRRYTSLICGCFSRMRKYASLWAFTVTDFVSALYASSIHTPPISKQLRPYTWRFAVRLTLSWLRRLFAAHD